MKKIFITVCISIFLFFIYLSSQPNFSLEMIREVNSVLSPERLENHIIALNRWPQWFHSLNDAFFVQGSVLQKGSVIQLNIDPHKGPSKKFYLLAEVIDYIPFSVLSLRITYDSSHRLTQLFQNLEWHLFSEKNSRGSILKGKVHAVTNNWRARLFGRMANHILLNQVFYFDVLSLSELNQPFSKMDLSPMVIPKNSSYGF